MVSGRRTTRERLLRVKCSYKILPYWSIHYDLKKSLRLACDASPYGVGAVISHVMENGGEKTIAFAS